MVWIWNVHLTKHEHTEVELVVAEHNALSPVVPPRPPALSLFSPASPCRGCAETSHHSLIREPLVAAQTYMVNI